MTAPAGWDPQRWGPERLDDLAAVCAAALPDEQLLPEDLEACCFEDPPADDDGGRVGPSWTVGVDGADGPVGAAALSLRRFGDLTTAHLQVLAVPPRHRRRGVARALVGACEELARGHGAALVQAGGAAPFYLFTGVDARWWEALCCFEQLGWSRSGVELDLVCPTLPPPAAGVRSLPGGRAPGGVAVEAVRSDADVSELLGFAERCYPHWRAELARAAAGGTVVLARSGGRVVGAAAHSVNRLGVVGPVAVDPDHQGGSVGTAMMRAVLTDLSAAGVTTAEIAWTSTVRFYARACGARVGRASLVLNRWL